MGPQQTTTTVSTSDNPVAVGALVTYTAGVSPVPDGGTVTFTDGGSPIGGCQALPINPANGTAVCQVTYTNKGSIRSPPPTRVTQPTSRRRHRR